MVKELVNRGYEEFADEDDAKPPVQKSVIVGMCAAVGALVYGLLTADLSLNEMTTLAILSALCLAPLIRWYFVGMKWIPFGEAFIAMHLLYYVIPAIMGRRDWSIYSDSDKLLTLWVVGAFVATAALAYYFILYSQWRFIDESKMLQREVPTQAMWVIFALWIVLAVLNVPTRYLWGSYANVYFAVMCALGAMAITNLSYRLGLGTFSAGERGFVLSGMVVAMGAGFASGFLQQNAQTLGSAFLAYAIGSKRVPVRFMLMCVFMLAILQLGKSEYRAMVWLQSGNNEKVSFVDNFETWIETGWKKLRPDNEITPLHKSQSVLERASLVQVLVRAVKDSPEEKPFLNGKTYAMLPELLVPRCFWKDKPRGTLPSETIGIYYGIQTRANSNTTGISVGPLTEAWANYGWYGIVGAAAFFGVIFGLASKISYNLVPSQTGWLFAAVLISYSMMMENAVAEFICSLLNALLMAIVILALFSRRYTFNTFSIRRGF